MCFVSFNIYLGIKTKNLKANKVLIQEANYKNSAKNAIEKLRNSTTWSSAHLVK